MTSLDRPERFGPLEAVLSRKASLRALYLEVYGRYKECLSRCPKDGIALELGSGAGFVKDVIPEMVTSDVIAYEGVDQVIDATRLPFKDSSLRIICMQNVLHHIPDAEAFFREASRCLKPGGRVFIMDQYLGWISTPLLKFGQHEPFSRDAKQWKFETTGPLSGANGALAWMIFERDRARFEKLFPELSIESYKPHTPFRYWLSGGLKSWSLLPEALFGAATALDRGLAALTPRLASFVDIEILKTCPTPFG